jgi:hypothetical protein
MVAISRELQAMIDEELAKELAPPPPSTARWDRISSELWAMIDEEQRKDLPEQWDDPPERSIRLVPPPQLTTEQAEAADRADAALLRIEAKLSALREHRVARHLKCGKTHTIHLRRDCDRGKEVDDMLLKTKCGRSDCPYCWRNRLTRTYNRAAAIVLRDVPESETLPRTRSLYVAETDWPEWETVDKRIRREHGGDVGRLRIRKNDNGLLVICSQPFAGSRPVRPDEACDLASNAIDHLHTARHSYRQLGDWNDAKDSEWRVVAHLPGTLDLANVADRLMAAGRKSRLFKTTELQGLVWRVESEAAAVRLETLITTPEELCPSLSEGKSDPYRGKSDTRPPSDDWGDVGDGWTPFDDDPPEPGVWTP